MKTMSSVVEDRRVDFDEFAEEYESVLAEQLSFFSKNRGYFSSYKARLASKYCTPFPKRILDFGCGIGLGLPHLQKAFPDAELCATDLSSKSLDHAKETYPDVTVVLDENIESYEYDLIHIACVFHHIPPVERGDIIRRLSGCLSRRGEICVFEHNPFNPVTRRMVATCRFDTDAELLSRRILGNLLFEHGDLKVKKSGYYLFIPTELTWLVPLEHLLMQIPLGGQYFVIASR